MKFNIKAQTRVHTQGQEERDIEKLKSPQAYTHIYAGGKTKKQVGSLNDKTGRY